jgi:hypothetical protein
MLLRLKQNRDHVKYQGLVYEIQILLEQVI